MTDSSVNKWDVETDLLVVGSGAGGMTAALTAKIEGLDVILVEKAACYGGSTACSGGGIWIPNNHLMKAAGIEDSEEKALTYMQNTVGKRTTKTRQAAYVKHAAQMIRYLSTLPNMQFNIVPGFSDYYPERPGGIAGGRGLEAKLFSAKKLGALFDEMRIPPLSPPHDIVLTIDEGRKLSLSLSNPIYVLTSMKVMLRNMFNRVFGRKHIALGRAVIGRLRLSLHEKHVPLWLSSPIRELCFDGSELLGAVVEREGKLLKVRARKGVVLAAGGFAHNLAMRETYHQKPVSTAWSSASLDDTGEVIELGISAGAAVDLMDETWGMPTILPPNEPPLPIVFERSYGGAIMVNSAGQRFTNEAASYVDVAHAMYDNNSDQAVSVPSWFVMDNRYCSRYIFGNNMPGKMARRYIENGFVIKADTLEELADKTGIDAAGLKETIRVYNEGARQGQDTEFRRGDSAYDRFYSDPSIKPNPCVVAMENAPFYAAKMYPGDIGTKGGLLTNENAEVLTKDGHVMKGLYAVGNNSASVMGNTYPGGGSTIGPAMTFGYIAAKHAAGHLQ